MELEPAELEPAELESAKLQRADRSPDLHCKKRVQKHELCRMWCCTNLSYLKSVLVILEYSTWRSNCYGVFHQSHR